MRYEDILAWWKEEKKDTKEDIYTLLDNFKILFAYHSGKIENETITLHDTREIFENGTVVNYTGDLRTLFEIVILCIKTQVFFFPFFNLRL